MTNTSSPLGAVRRRLTLWFLLTIGLVIAVLGGGLFVAIRHQFRTELDASLLRATREIERAAGIRAVESQGPQPVVDALDELRIPDRTLYLFDATGAPIRPETVAPWIRDAARLAGTTGRTDTQREESDERILRLHAERFTLPDGTVQVAVVVADEMELEQRYASLIAAFGAAALAALLLVAAAAALLVRKSTEPVERNIARMQRFMADVAHELRTPVAVLRARTDVALQQPRDPAAYQETLRGIDAELRRVSTLVDDLLTLARADAGERPTRRESLFLDDLTLDACDAVRDLARLGEVTLEVGRFEESPVTGDAGLLRQLLLILLDNAIKYTPSGGSVTVEVGMDGEHPVVTIRDTGPGIPPSDLDHVFERFYRGDQTRHRQPTDESGAGLGLSIARWIADTHGATLTLESPDKGGTVATLRFA